MTNRNRKSASGASEDTVRPGASNAPVAFGDLDERLVLRDDFAEEMRRSLAEVDTGGRRPSLTEVAGRLDLPE